ncbi:trehalose-phosphatase [Jannaschia sp. M317]|uniref:trehalose-phosphatase n=1 Tax=Jannaschia sp. M317 TaxID=2867011 RepID=UPI0021A360D2|nr:trehalose-phosphatase [Jannaschia sp. M317]UWQ18946.1 trehalose-phosphatase [Jannaschia sp. M317]
MLYYQMTGFMEGDSPTDQGRITLPKHEDAALFLDFDGTLVEIADRPDGITVPERITTMLKRAQDRLDGRVALVSGRSVSDLEAFLPDFDGPLIGAHGAERRIEGTTEHTQDFDLGKIATLQKLVEDYASLQSGFLVETKPTGVVLHYRQAQEHGALALHFMESLAEAADGFRLQPALCAYEIKPDSVGKDIALSDLLETAAFKGKTPIYAGDDLTDEPPLELVKSLGGTAIKIGGRESVAEYGLETPEMLLRLLEKWLA